MNSRTFTLIKGIVMVGSLCEKQVTSISLILILIVNHPFFGMMNPTMIITLDQSNIWGSENLFEGLDL